MNTTTTIALLCTTLGLACGHSDDPFQGNESEVITTVELRFMPEVGGTPIVATFNDPDGDGGEAPMVDDIELDPGIYEVAVHFENRLETPAEDITVEVADESHVHQVFFTGSAVDGPASDHPSAPLLHRYEDEDANGLSIGLTNSVTASTGNGDLVITLRHLPPIGDTPIKTAELSSQVRDSGFSGIGGSSDAQVSFPVMVR